MKYLTLVSTLLILGTTGCASVGNVLNPFQETPPPVAFNGEPNDHALNSSAASGEEARDELDTIARYPRAHAPQPVNPVLQPAVVRLMWVPDHLNKNGDLVPSHYYYLKVLEDRWAVTDVFEQQQLLGAGAEGSAIPYVTEGSDRK